MPAAGRDASATPPAEALCRDCLAFTPAPAHRCRACGSPRLLLHPERDRLAIAHVDCDAFYATIEKRDDPALRDKPVIVGGGRRGVVSTACYIARTYGVHSAMPMFKALAACPHAVVVRPNMEKYAGVARQVRALMLELTPLVEPLSIDEAFLDLSGTQDLHKAAPALSLASFARRVEQELAITVSIGLAPNKFLAKIASDLDKPRGFSIIGEAERLDFLADKRVTILPGVGEAARRRLEQLGIRTIADLRRLDPLLLQARLGSDGLRLYRLAHGDDARTVSPQHEAKGISAETTFETDLSEPEKLLPILLSLAEKVSRRLKKAGLAGRSVTLKLRTADFRIISRSRSGLPPTQLAGRLFDVAKPLLLREATGPRFRLIGIGAGDLCPAAEADRGDLADPDAARDVSMESAIDRVRDRFGNLAIQRGTVFAARETRGDEPAERGEQKGRTKRDNPLPLGEGAPRSGAGEGLDSGD